MKLRFEVKQVETFPSGVDVPGTTTVEANPSKLSRTDLNLIADRLHGIDVCQLWNSDKGTEKQFDSAPGEVASDQRPCPVRIVAKGPMLADLLVAVRENQAEIEHRQERHRRVALGLANSGLSRREMAMD